jgi:hypothetical protein
VTVSRKSPYLLPFAVLVLVLTGCSGGSGSSTASRTSASATITNATSSAAATSSPAPTTTSAATPSSSPTSSSKTAGMNALPASCPPNSLLETDTGLHVVSTGGNNTAACVYTGVGDIVSINFALTPSLTAAQAESKVKEQGTTSAFQTVQGVGDAAFYDTPATSGKPGSYIAVLSGTVSFHIVANSVIAVTKLAHTAQDIIKGY